MLELLEVLKWKWNFSRQSQNLHVGRRPYIILIHEILDWALGNGWKLAKN